jgi:hypothetical protein
MCVYVYIYIYIYIINKESSLTIYTLCLRTLICQIKKDYESLDYLLTYVRLEVNL